MVTFDQWIADIRQHLPDLSSDSLKRAFDIAAEAHGNQLRKSGEPYLVHPCEVVKILARLRMDTSSLIAGLLHDVAEDTPFTLERLEQEFGIEVRDLVDGVTKLGKLSFFSRHDRQAENFRKMIVAMGKDIRVILIKLADRLHNMRTLEHMSSERQIDIAQETLDIYAPISHRLGIEWIRIELEDLALKYLKPETYAKIIQLVAREKSIRDGYVEDVIEIIKEKLKQAEFTEYRIKGRPKHLYSIFKKMESSELSFDEIHDILGFRIITRTVPQCYEALGVIHSTFTPVPGRFKDYIAIPKANLYQSLHTTVIGPYGERIEIQIRTEEMDRIAEEGIAAHWMYKTEKGRINPKELEQFGWVRRLIEWQQEVKDSSEFMQTLKVDLFADEVYVFSPKGDVLALPKGATPIDYAYSIHSKLGEKCIGAKVSGRIVPLTYRLRNGDTVEILTSDNQFPRKDWLDFVVTSKAKNKIRAFIKKEQQDQSRQIGTDLLEKEFRKHELNFQKLLKKGELDQLHTEFHVANLDELLIRVGYGKISATDVIQKFTGVEPPKESERPAPSESQKPGRKFLSPVRIRGVDDVLIRIAQCCHPIPGDEIIGFVTRGRGLTVHTRDCPKVLNYDEERKVEVFWDSERRGEFNIKISILSIDKPGILAETTKTISNLGGNIIHAFVRTTPDRKGVTIFDVTIRDLEQLHGMLNAIEKIDGVISAERVKI